MVKQVLRDTGAEISVTLYVEGEATEADGAVTVTVVRDSDGSTVVDAAAATNEAAVGVYSYQLTPTHLTDLDLLRVTWTASLGGTAGQQFRNTVEVVGGYTTTLAAIEAALEGVTATPEQLAEARQWGERAIEDACGVAFRPRYGRDELDGRGRRKLRLKRPRPLVVRSASVNDTALSVEAVADLKLRPSGVLIRESGWSAGDSNIVVVYEHGYESAPEPVSRAVVKLAVHYLTPNPMSYDERATRIETEDASYALVTPGVRGAVHSLPEVNAVIEQYGYRGAG